MAKSPNARNASPKTESATAESKEPARRRLQPLLLETAWEVCNPVGGIYTVIRSKLKSMGHRWGKRYCVLGPYVEQTAAVEFESAAAIGPFGQAVKTLRQIGIKAHYGHWLVTGRPRAILFDLESARANLDSIRHNFRSGHGITLPTDDALIDDVVLFGWLVEQFMAVLADREGSRRQIIAHFHEWQGATAIPEIRRRQMPIKTVFTTHATMLGRYVAGNDRWYYDHVPFVDWQKDSKRFNILPQVSLERAAAHGAHVFTTVSNVTGFECEHLLGRQVSVVTPNGLNIERFTADHEFQNLHREYKERIHRFVMGHFFPSYTFDLNKTLYLFISGRYEYRNKGFDMFIESLAQLNHRMRESGSDKTVVAFFVTRRPSHGINSKVLNSRAMLAEVRRTCDNIKDEMGLRLFHATAMGKRPTLDDLVDEYWRLRLRRTTQAWKTDRLPYIVTHDLEDTEKDEVVAQLRESKLVNNAHDPVKVVYHPDFIDASNPLWGMDYDQFVRGCHMGVFPSFYEPWGYTPLECVARGIPAITTDVSGFGSYVQENLPDHKEFGLHILERRYKSYSEACAQLTDQLHELTVLDQRQRITLRNKVDQLSTHFDWDNLAKYYDEAHEMALKSEY
jgi:glycogen(starch) synthase